MRRNGLILAVVGLLVGIALYLGDQSPETFLPKPKSQASDATSYALLQNSESRQFGEEGQLSYTYKSDLMEYFRVDLSKASPEDYSLVNHPQLVFYGKDLPWFIEAKSGKITDQGDTLTLWDEVKIWQDRADGKRTLLTTEDLIIKPRSHLINTDAPVTIVSPTGTLGATGLSVDLNSQHLKLLSRVKGHHEPIFKKR